jgi:hypothetical protein
MEDNRGIKALMSKRLKLFRVSEPSASQRNVNHDESRNSQCFSIFKPARITEYGLNLESPEISFSTDLIMRSMETGLKGFPT